MERISYSNYRLTTGRVVDFNMDVIGIGEDLTISAGSDNSVEAATDKPEDIYSDDPLTPSEVMEVCDLAIARWEALRELAVSALTLPTSR